MSTRAGPSTVKAKSHKCNQSDVLPPVVVSIFIVRLCHGQFLLPCDCLVLGCEQSTLKPSVWPWPAGDVSSKPLLHSSGPLPAPKRPEENHGWNLEVHPAKNGLCGWTPAYISWLLCPYVRSKIQPEDPVKPSLYLCLAVVHYAVRKPKIWNSIPVENHLAINGHFCIEWHNCF